MYGSAKDVLTNLYPELSQGGFCVIDNYALRGCKAAVDDFRRENSITEEMQRIDWTGTYWRKR